MAEEGMKQSKFLNLPLVALQVAVTGLEAVHFLRMQLAGDLLKLDFAVA